MSTYTSLSTLIPTQPVSPLASPRPLSPYNPSVPRLQQQSWTTLRLIDTHPKIYVVIGRGGSEISSIPLTDSPDTAHWGLLVGTQLWELLTNAEDDAITVVGPKVWNKTRQDRFLEKYEYGRTVLGTAQIQGYGALRAYHNLSLGGWDGVGPLCKFAVWLSRACSFLLVCFACLYRLYHLYHVAS
jgi:hypothetical protein